jgi:hypothetical protein
VALLGVLALAVIFWAIFHHSWSHPAPDGSETERPAETELSRRPPEKLLRLAQEHLSQGHFHLAMSAAGAALASLRKKPELSATPEHRALEQLYREASVLSDLSPLSLTEIIEAGGRLSAAEWDAVFPHRYQGQSVVLDMEVRRVAGRYQHSLLLFPSATAAPQDAALLELDGLEVLARLPLEEPQRLIFAARLQSVRQEKQAGAWVVRLAPDSGVLLSDPNAAVHLCPALNDVAARQVLDRQRGWLLGPAQAAAPR